MLWDTRVLRTTRAGMPCTLRAKRALDPASAIDKLRAMLGSQRLSIGLLLALASASIACGKAQEKASTADAVKPPAAKTEDAAPSGEPAPKSAKHERRPIDPARTGTIHGVVHFDGTPPERKLMAIGSTAGCEHHPEPPLTEEVLVDDGKLANVFVYIKQGLEDWIVPPPSDAPAVLSQTGCMYRPRVLGMRTGQKLLVRNSDPATHNVHARPERNEGFNQSQTSGSPDVEWTATKPEVMISFGCDIHPWMKAWIGVRDHPYFAVTGADGSFTLAGVPAGEYVLESWHEKYLKKSGKVTVETGKTAEIQLAYKP